MSWCRPGSFVRCAVTGKPIPIDELIYWNVDRQEPYADADAPTRPSSATAAAPDAWRKSSVRRRFSVISNGHGEDLDRRRDRRAPARDDRSRGLSDARRRQCLRGVCPIVGPRAELACRGLAQRQGSLLRDIKLAASLTIAPALRFLRRTAGRLRPHLVVGDMIGRPACLRSPAIADLVYLDVYKTGYGRLYLGLEKLRPSSGPARPCSAAPTLWRADARSRRRRRPLRRQVDDGYDPSGDYDAQARRAAARAVTLLPGSRAPTVANFALQVEALRTPAGRTEARTSSSRWRAASMPRSWRTPTGLSHGSIRASSRRSWASSADGGLDHPSGRGGAGQVLAASDVVLSQAGTATVQAWPRQARHHLRTTRPALALRRGARAVRRRPHAGRRPSTRQSAQRCASSSPNDRRTHAGCAYRPPAHRRPGRDAGSSTAWGRGPLRLRPSTAEVDVALSPRRLRLEQAVQVHDEIAHLRRCRRSAAPSASTRVGRGVVGIDPDDIDLAQILERDALDARARRR